MWLPSFFRNTPANEPEPAGEVAPIAELPARHEGLRIHVFTDATGLEHVALVSGDVFKQERLARIPQFVGPGPLNHAYLQTKVQRSGHRDPNGAPEA